MPFANEHSARITDPSKYKKIRRKNDEFGKGIHVYFGVLSDGKTEVQSIHFDADKFTPSEARKWLKDNDYKPIEFEEASNDEKETEKTMNKIEYKSFKIDVKNVTESKANGKKYGIIKGYVSTFDNIDRGYDVVEKGAFLKGLEWLRNNGKKIPICWQHNLDMPIGGVDISDIYEDSKGLFLNEGKLYIDDIEKAREIHTCIKEGIVTEMSFGYMINNSAIETIDNENVRKLKELIIYEISPVVVPMNPNAKITDVKSFITNQLPIAEHSTEWNEDEAIKRVSKTLGDNYKMFLYENTLPFADIVDGELKAIPKAIFKITNQIKNNELDIDYKTSIKIKTELSRYYDKMNIDSPFKGVDIDGTITLNDIFNIYDNKKFSLSEKKHFLKKLIRRGTLSKSAAKMIVDKINFEQEKTKDNNDILINEFRQISKLIEKQNVIDNKKKKNKIILDELDKIKRII